MSKLKEKSDYGLQIRVIADVSHVKLCQPGNPIRYADIFDNTHSRLVAAIYPLYQNDIDFHREIYEAMSAVFGAEYELLSFLIRPRLRDQLYVNWASLVQPQTPSDDVKWFLYVIATLINPNPPPIIAIDRLETNLHPIMQQIAMEYAIEAARHTRVHITTQSPTILESLEDAEPMPIITTVETLDGQTNLRTLSAKAVLEYAKHYSLGDLLRTNEIKLIESEMS